MEALRGNINIIGARQSHMYIYRQTERDRGKNSKGEGRKQSTLGERNLCVVYVPSPLSAFDVGIPLNSNLSFFSLRKLLYLLQVAWCWEPILNKDNNHNKQITPH